MSNGAAGSNNNRSHGRGVAVGLLGLIIGTSLLFVYAASDGQVFSRIFSAELDGDGDLTTAPKETSITEEPDNNPEIAQPAAATIENSLATRSLDNTTADEINRSDESILASRTESSIIDHSQSTATAVGNQQNSSRPQQGFQGSSNEEAKRGPTTVTPPLHDISNTNSSKSSSAENQSQANTPLVSPNDGYTNNYAEANSLLPVAGVGIFSYSDGIILVLSEPPMDAYLSLPEDDETVAHDARSSEDTETHENNSEDVTQSTNEVDILESPPEVITIEEDSDLILPDSNDGSDVDKGDTPNHEDTSAPDTDPVDAESSDPHDGDDEREERDDNENRGKGNNKGEKHGNENKGGGKDSDKGGRHGKSD